MTYSAACWWWRAFGALRRLNQRGRRRPWAWLPGGLEFCPSCRESRQDGITTVILGGEIDINNAPKLRRFLQARACARTRALLLDLSQVERIDTSVLATLVEYYQQAQSFGGEFALAGSSNTRLRRFFELVQLTQLFKLHSNIQEARQAIQQSLSNDRPKL